ncbi:IS1182 family transposase [Phocaeicola barnesiae]|uniref:IS1182 family transposase n=1 Tax=Phocaeicola barnesiae TaxID=376804 RepID=UPI00037826E0|nr:IS1182 family transposase [Phocaeicola barnesiae]
MAKIHFRPYNPNQTVLFPQRIDEDIPAEAPVRILNAIVDNLDLSSFHKLYKELGRAPYHPRMMLKAVLYAYMNNIYSCRKIESSLTRDIHFIWLAGYEKPDYRTIDRFRNRVKDEINRIFTQIVLILASKGFISLDVEYVDGTKIESKANRYTFVWRKNVERNRARLLEKIRILLQQIDDVIAQDNACIDDSVEFTPSMLTDMISELKCSLEETPAASTREDKKVQRQKARQLKQLESHRNKLAEYDRHMKILDGRNSYSKTDPDATFMRMKEDHMRNGQTKPGYNLQIGTENQFLVDFALFPNPTDTLTMIPFETSFMDRYGHFPSEEVADSGYGSEENYRFMEENGMEAYVKYNFFHKEQRPRYVADPFRQESFHYNEEEDYYVCPMGQHMGRTGVRHSRTESGYITESVRYRAVRCEGCPLRCMCFKSKSQKRTIEVNHRLKEYKRKARERLTSEKGIKHRGQRCIEPEAVFGQIKYDMAYKRFRHFGKDKVTMDFAFFAIAFNIKKMCAKIKKEKMTDKGYQNIRVA